MDGFPIHRRLSMLDMDDLPNFSQVLFKINLKHQFYIIMMARVGVILKTNKHIKAYLISNFGDCPVIDSKSVFHNHFLFCLTHRLVQHMDTIIDYQESCKLYITRDDFERYGCWLNNKQAHLFNMHVDSMMKNEIVIRIQMILEYNPNATLSSAIYDSLKRMGLTDEDWNPESITRYFHRYRQRKGLPLLHEKKINKSSGKMSDLKTSS